MEYVAHIKKESDRFITQSISDHISGTAELCAEFANLFQNSDWGHLLGLWHDLGKLSEDFQEYIKVNSGYEEDDQKKPKTDHTSAGAILAKEFLPQYWPPLSYCIAGHHAGLLNFEPEAGIPGDLSNRLMKVEFYQNIKSRIPQGILRKEKLSLPAGKSLPAENVHLWIRMLFSCLVDADFLDTERFMNPESFQRRGRYASLNELDVVFTKHMEKLSGNAPVTDVNLMRKKILEQCICSGGSAPGFFSLTVPTGGGKTLASMAWALEHAKKIKKSRIIFAIPYTSIIAQTAQIYRGIFGTENVIEHHSSIEDSSVSQQGKLASENWDAPVIVTTNVQLLESLFANRTSKCRKLHNLVNSIIIFDEAQMLPPEFLNPIVDILKALVDDFKVSILFSSATQPALTGEIGCGRYRFKGIESDAVREIVSDSLTSSLVFKRVKLYLPKDANRPTEWYEIAEDLRKYKQALCIVNSRKDCRTLFNLMPEGTIHLSRMMCSAHIMDSITTIKVKLKAEETVRVISTQLIEAGVDIDFPVVFRSISGLDSIAQSAGRCNREGKLNEVGELGYTRVFCPVSNTPPGLLRKGADTMQELMYLHKNEEFLTPAMFTKYFTLFYSKVSDFDKPGIKRSLYQDARQMKFQFATAAKDFRLIDDNGEQSILVEYKDGSDLINMLRRKGPEPWLMRKLQRYSVSVNKHDLDILVKAGLIEQVHGCWVQAYEKLYNPNCGMMYNNEWLEEIHIV